MNIVPSRRPDASVRAGASLEVSDAVEPTDEELAAIEREWPQIETELAELDAWIQALGDGGRASSLDVRRWRRAQRRVLATHSLPAFDGHGSQPLPCRVDLEVA